MFSTMSTATFELNSSYYTTVSGSSALDAFSVSVIESESIRPTPYMLPAYIRTTSMVVCIAVMVLGVVGNLMVPLVVFRGKDMRNSTNIFLVNLSVADLCVLLFCTPTVLIEVNSSPEVWPLGEHMCKIIPFVELTVAHASVLTILAISFERYYAICEPLRAGYVCTKARATFLCFLAWLAAAICTSPMIWVTQYRHIHVNITAALPISKEGVDREAIISMPACLTQATTTATTVFFLFIVLLFFAVPLAILLVLYSFIVSHLIRDTSGTNGNTSDSYHSRARKQVVLMLLTVVFSFFLCLLPFNALTLYIVLAPNDAVFDIDEDTYFIVLYFSRIMFYLNSAINPILYNLMSSKFRLGFFKLCGLKARRTRSARTTLRSTITAARRTASNDQQENFL